MNDDTRICCACRTTGEQLLVTRRRTRDSCSRWSVTTASPPSSPPPARRPLAGATHVVDAATGAARLRRGRYDAEGAPDHHRRPRTRPGDRSRSAAIDPSPRATSSAHPGLVAWSTTTRHGHPTSSPVTACSRAASATTDPRDRTLPRSDDVTTKLFDTLPDEPGSIPASATTPPWATAPAPAGMARTGLVAGPPAARRAAGCVGGTGSVRCAVEVHASIVAPGTDNRRSTRAPARRPVDSAPP